MNFLSSMTAAPGFTASDVLLSVTTISFDIAGLELWLPLITGGRVDVAPTDALSDGEALARLISESGATVMQATPATWRLLLEAAWPGNPQLRILCGGEALPQALADALAPRCAELWNMYGPTETTVWSAAQRIRAGERVTVGGPVRNTGLYVLDQRRQPQPIGVPGELYIGGGGVARGYHGRADLTAERFVSHPFDSAPGARMYRTGDLVRRRADGSLEFLGRLDHQVKVRGFRIELGEIEAVLATHPAVDQAVAVAQPTESGDSRLVAYYVPRQGSAPEQESLRAHLQGRLPAYMVPGALIGLTTMPLTPNGKVDRKALPRLDVAPGPDSTGPLPRNPLEAAIAAEMALVLERPAVGIHQSFFDLGGHSLLAMRLLGRLKRGPAPGLTLQAIFEHPTVAELAALAGASGAAVDTPSPIRRRPVEAPRPLSFGQRLLWVQAEMDPGLAAYNFPLARRLRGPLQPEALQTALDGLAIRHEVLRTVLTPAGDEPVQTVLPPEAVPLYRADLHHAPEPLGAAMAQARELAARPFNLAADRPLRAALYRLGEDDHVLLLVTHHAVADGWSAGVLLNDLAALYDAAVGQRASGLPALGISYGDFAAWQRDRTGEAERARLLDYWRRTLADLPATLELQTDHPRTSTVSGPGAEVVVTLAPALLERLRRVGEPGGATLFMTLLAAWQALLFRYSGQRDILVATPFAGRNTPETEGLVGYFAQTLLMRARRGVNQSFTQLLQQVRETAISAFQHADVPLDDLLRELRGAQGSGGFQAMFTYQGATAAPVGLGGLTVESLRLHTGAAKAELALFATERSDGLQLAIEYRSDLFDRETIERMQGHLAILLEGIIENPATPVDRLPMLSGAERHRLLDEWSGSATAYPRNSTISARFREIAARAPDLPAVVVDGETITYRALSERAGRLAGYLRARGIGSGALVAIALPRSADLVAALIAVLEAGAAYLPLDPDYPAERLRFMLKDAAAPLLLTCAALASVFPAESGCDVVLLEDLAAELGRLPTAPAPVEPTAESPAYVMYTSGSTGVPKGVVVPHRAVLRLVLDTDYLPPAAFTRVLGYAPITFDASTLELWGPLLNGGAVVLAPARPLSLAELGQVIVDGGVTTAWLTAALFHEMADTQIESLRGIRYLLAGGDVLSPAHVRRVLEALPGCVLINGYGPTENTTFTCCHRITPADAARGNIPIGRPIANTQVYVLDEALQPVPVGVAGELLAGGDGLAQGYLGRPDLTTERFVPDPFRPGERLYRTGDRVRWRQDRSIEFLGRLDDQVKLRGHRIELAEVEAAVGRLAGVAAVTAMVREDVPGDRRLVAYYVAANGTAPT
ncbi:MAG TPA: amino acid adenylation domain-containing protein, partial [Gemmatimonadales bacterium]|nr:amino acid adenylation domain-containing protein [Gemmatimonadales bacterium]